MDVAERRVPLNRERVLRAAVELADRTGLDTLSMRNLAQELGVVPMALYKHVANKDELLDGMVDTVIASITPAPVPVTSAPVPVTSAPVPVGSAPVPVTPAQVSVSSAPAKIVASSLDPVLAKGEPAAGEGWKGAVRQRILGARQALLRHPWAWRLIHSRTDPSPAMLAYLDSVIGLFLAGGFSPDQTHHIVHALGTRMLGYTQDLFNDSQPAPPEVQLAMARAMADRYPSLATMAAAAAHDESSVVGSGCDDQFEFEFALNLLLDGFDRLPR
ncbi:TetR/AcrR family transcriptional regulator [Actinoplanes regularis]|uniref:TetR/AcrR family transcriptional regulator n=1 Tax=Actinoplanes regularis TaxID=52697 RepID=UPI0024A42DE2|nr:TetR/AcrR family transcriptional regulator C-terminal domain-containing protein [Actinoplanes regularis]GLW27360.1 TetR family transcriptional regulator [Actinoplanes regularis]